MYTARILFVYYIIYIFKFLIWKKDETFYFLIVVDIGFFIAYEMTETKKIIYLERKFQELDEFIENFPDVA